MSPHGSILDPWSKRWVRVRRVVKDGVVIIPTPETQEMLKRVVCGSKMELL
jgi:hypothetical protein